MEHAVTDCVPVSEADQAAGKDDDGAKAETVGTAAAAEKLNARKRMDKSWSGDRRQSIDSGTASDRNLRSVKQCVARARAAETEDSGMANRWSGIPSQPSRLGILG